VPSPSAPGTSDTATTLCTFCPNLCRQKCPVSTAEPRETLIPRAKMATLGRLRSGALALRTESTAALLACTGCGACTEACRHHVEPARHLFAGRALAASSGARPPALEGLTERVRVLGARASSAMRAGVGPARVRSSGQRGLLPACARPEQARVTLAVLDRAAPAGQEPVALVDTALGCGGYPLLAGGEEEAFVAHARRLASELAGFAQVVVACPACAFTLRTEYAPRGVRLSPEVVDLATVLGEAADRLPIARTLGPAFYHDPCYLGRRSGVYDAPRAALARAVTTVHEFSRARADSGCCGGGGLLPLTMPDTAAAIADARLDEVREAEVRTVVTACPTCTDRLARPGLSVRDLIDVLDEATRPSR